MPLSMSPILKRLSENAAASFAGVGGREMKPRLQIIIMSYNRAHWLGECVRSFLAQTYRDFELIVLDNASDQDIEGVMREIDDQRVSLIRNETNLGGRGNFMKACRIAQGDYLMIFHDDDCAHPRLLEYQIRALEDIPTALMVLTNCDIMWKPERMGTYDEGVPYVVTRLAGPLEIFREERKEGRIIGFGGTLYRTSTMKESLDWLDQIQERFSLCADRPWLFYLAMKGPVAYLDTPMYQVRYHEAQDSQRLPVEYRYLLENLKFQKEIFGQTMDPADLKAWEISAAGCLLHAMVWHAKNQPRGLVGVLISMFRQDLMTPARMMSTCAGIIARRVFRKSVRSR